MPRVQRFGGAHTQKKLDTVARYLQAYVTVMKKQRFNLSYVDGFAGSGASQAAGLKEQTLLIESNVYDSESIIDGSPVRALGIDPPFDRYVFIDSNPENIISLKSLNDSFPQHKINVLDGDANDRLQSFAGFLNKGKFERAVVFLDPFGLSVRWETICSLAETGKVDLWYLVPVHGMSRQIRTDGTFLPSAKKIDDLWGSDGWRPKAVKSLEPEEDLFGGIDQRHEKVARAKQFSEMFRDRLAEVFKGGVAKLYLPLGKGKLHEFSLMFACANPSPPASAAALRIADHILRKV